MRYATAGASCQGSLVVFARGWGHLVARGRAGHPSGARPGMTPPPFCTLLGGPFGRVVPFWVGLLAGPLSRGPGQLPLVPAAAGGCSGSAGSWCCRPLFVLVPGSRPPPFGAQSHGLYTYPYVYRLVPRGGRSGWALRQGFPPWVTVSSRPFVFLARGRGPALPAFWPWLGRAACAGPLAWLLPGGRFTTVAVFCRGLVPACGCDGPPPRTVVPWGVSLSAAAFWPWALRGGPSG